MEPEWFGRKLGIGVRVASRVVKERMDRHAQPSSHDDTARQQAARVPVSTAAAQTPSISQEPSRVEATSRQAAETLRQTSQSVARTVRKQAPLVATKSRGVREGTRRFGRAMWGPFAHVSSVLWSEVTGLFFGLFAFYFATGVYKYHAGFRGGGENQKKLVLDVILTVVFGYFAASAFYVARKKEKKRG